MASSISNVLHYTKPQISPKNFAPNSLISKFSSPYLRFPRKIMQNQNLICAASATGSSGSEESDLNPYEILGVSPIAGFEKVKVAYAKKRKEAESMGDEATAGLLDKAYDKLMMGQLSNRKKGVTYGSFKVSKDIKYADNQPIVPWGPRFTKSSLKDMHINLAIATTFTAWIVFKRDAEYKPLQFLAFAFVYRIFEKLAAYQSPVSPTITVEGEDDGRGLRTGKRLLRALGLVFGCIALSSLAYTGALNIIEYLGSYIPAFLYNNQELIITSASAIGLYIIASYYR